VSSSLAKEKKGKEKGKKNYSLSNGREGKRLSSFRESGRVEGEKKKDDRPFSAQKGKNLNQPRGRKLPREKNCHLDLIRSEKKRGGRKGRKGGKKQKNKKKKQHERKRFCPTNANSEGGL